MKRVILDRDGKPLDLPSAPSVVIDGRIIPLDSEAFAALAEGALEDLTESND
jgi:hypothetical protein